MPEKRDIVGIIPAGGIASRLGPLPCSKELLPIPIPGRGPVPAAAPLLINYRKAGASAVHWIIRKGKWDIPNYFGSGEAYGMGMHYSIMHYPFGPPFTMFEACPLIRDKTVLLGFPDILLSESDPFSPLVKALNENSADVCLGIVTANEPQKVDVIEMNAENRVSCIIPKPKDNNLTSAWIWAAWNPKFTYFLHAFCTRYIADSESSGNEMPEVHTGHVIQAFIESGGSVLGIPFPKSRFLDIGSPNGYASIPEFINSC